MFGRLACTVAHAAGSPHVLIGAATFLTLAFLFWAASGYSEAVLDGINVTISVVSLLLLFLLQGSQNRDGAAIQAKLDALVKASDAPNEFAGIDRLSEAEVIRLREGA